MTVEELLDHCVNTAEDYITIFLKDAETYDSLGIYTWEGYKQYKPYHDFEVDLFHFCSNKTLFIFIILDK